jgi:transcriptional regulator with XRE-family HTH domain
MKTSETLSEYVQRIMRQKNLSVRDIKRRADGKIAASYISRIINDKVRNLSVDKIASLAEGLGEDIHDVFAAASGKPPKLISGVDPLLLLDVMQQALRQPESLEVLQRWLHISPEYQKSVLKWMRFISEQPRTKKRRKKN